MINLWDFQDKNLAQVDDYFSHGGNALLLQQPTGTGKSLVSVEFINRRREQRKPVYFVTHSKSLLWQFSDHLTEFGLPHGIVAPGCPTLRYRIQVISAASLKTRMHMLDEPEFLIFEEAHHSTTAMFTDIIKLWPKAKLLGLTATPNRPDGTPLSMYEKIIVSPGVRWFIDNCYLADFDYYIPCEFNTTGIHRSKGDFRNSELTERAKEDKKRIGNLVEYYEKYATGLPGIAFGTSIADSEEIADRFCLSGYNMKAIHSKSTDPIKETLDKCRTGEQPLISSCDMIGEGVDVKGLTVDIDARPTDSVVVQIQHWGRVLRAKYAPGHDLSTLAGRRAAMEEGGKGNAKLLDFSSNYLRHGLPDDEREWSLDGKVKEKAECLYKRCPNCQRPIRRLLMICPECGYEFPRLEIRQEETPEREGELVHINDLKRADRNGLTLLIMRQAESMKDAVRIAQKAGANAQAAWYVWHIIMGKSLK